MTAKTPSSPDNLLTSLREAGGRTLAESFVEANRSIVDGPGHLLVIKLSSAQLAFLEARRSEVNARLSAEAGVSGGVDFSLPELLHNLVDAWRQEARWPE